MCGPGEVKASIAMMDLPFGLVPLLSSGCTKGLYRIILAFLSPSPSLEYQGHCPLLSGKHSEEERRGWREVGPKEQFKWGFQASTRVSVMGRTNVTYQCGTVSMASWQATVPYRLTPVSEPCGVSVGSDEASLPFVRSKQ